MEDAKKYISLEERKKVLLGILEYIDSFCKDNDIRYFMVGGTLLGAVRHKGFIPWDDDVDIGMLRRDYDLFISKFATIENKQYYLCCPEVDKEYYLPFAKICDSNTVLQEHVKHAKAIGVNVDVFPYDNCGLTASDAWSFAKKFLPLRRVLLLKGLQTSKDRSLFRNVLIVFAQVLLSALSRKTVIRKLNLGIASRKDEESQFVGEIALMSYGQKEIYCKELFEETIDLEFEGKLFKAPSGYDEFLTHTYGDYLVLPPEEKRVTHHGNDAWWK